MVDTSLKNDEGYSATRPSGKASMEHDDLCNHVDPKVVEWMELLGFEYTYDMGNGLMFNHKVFTLGDLHVFTEQATFFYKEVIYARIKELQSIRRVHADYLTRGQLNDLDEQIDTLRNQVEE